MNLIAFDILPYAAMKIMNVLSVENLTKSFGERIIFEEFEFGNKQRQESRLFTSTGSLLIMKLR